MTPEPRLDLSGVVAAYNAGATTGPAIAAATGLTGGQASYRLGRSRREGLIPPLDTRPAAMPADPMPALRVPALSLSALRRGGWRNLSGAVALTFRGRTIAVLIPADSPAAVAHVTGTTPSDQAQTHGGMPR